MSRTTSQPVKKNNDRNANHSFAQAFAENGDRLTHHAADVVVDHVVRPMADAVRAVEQRAEQTNRSLSQALDRMEDKIHLHPARALACAAGAGFLAGLWFCRK